MISAGVSLGGAETSPPAPVRSPAGNRRQPDARQRSERVTVVTASARSLPFLMYSVDEDVR